MAGSGGGFFGGLLEGVGGALLDAKQEQHKAQIEQNKTLASVLLKGLDADPTRETASAVLPKVAELLHEPVQTLFGIKLGKSGGKGGSQLSQMFEGVAASFPTRDELQERETKAAAAKAGATAGATVTGRGEAQAKLSDLLLSTGRAKTREEANQMAGLKEPTALRPPTEGSRGAFINGALADAEATKGEKLTPAEEQQVRAKATQDFAEKSKTSSSDIRARDLYTSAVDNFTFENKRRPNPVEDRQLMQTALKDAAEAKGKGSATAQRDERRLANAKKIADGIRRGIDPPDLARLYGASADVRADLDDSGFDQVQAQLQWDAAKKLTASLNSNQRLQFFGLGKAVVNTLDEVHRLADKLQQGGIQKWNQAKRSTILQVYGNTPQSKDAVQYLAAVNTLKEEFANLANGGYAPTEAAWKLANDQINEDYGAADLDASLDEVQRLVNFRLHAITDIQPEVAGKPSPNFPPATPKAGDTSKGAKGTTSGLARDPQGNIIWAPQK